MIVDSSYSVNTCFDGSINVDYIGECREKKNLLHELFNAIHAIYSDEVIIESRLTIKQNGAFLELCIKDSGSIKLSDVLDFVNSFLDIIGDIDEKNTNKHN